MHIDCLASLKRAVARPDIRIIVLDHWQPQLRGTTRKPTKIQTNGYWFEGPDHTGKIGRMWAMIPKASELKFNPDGSITFFPDSERCWTICIEQTSDELERLEGTYICGCTKESGKEYCAKHIYMP